MLGTFANCSAGKTPWGTYLTSEENIDDYFACGPKPFEYGKDAALVEAYRRFPLRENSFYGWDAQDSRFDLRAEPREALRFGWMVEIDPHDPNSVPRKRIRLVVFTTKAPPSSARPAMSRPTQRRRKFEYIYKFVTRDRSTRRTPRRTATSRSWHAVLRALRRRRKGEWLPPMMTKTDR